jgi:hypothetical protein
MGHDFELTDRTKQENGVTHYCIACASCKKEKWIEESLVCAEHKCVPYVVGVNHLTDHGNKRRYSLRCYRCTRCHRTWNDPDSKLLDGDWYAVDGKAIHASELGEKKPSILYQIRDCKSIKEARELVNKVLRGEGDGS